MNAPTKSEAAVEGRKAGMAYDTAKRRYERLGRPLWVAGLVTIVLPINGPLGLGILLLALSSILIGARTAFDLADAQQYLQAMQVTPGCQERQEQHHEGTSQVIGMAEWKTRHILPA